jgi:hypothetical protein
VGESYMKIKQVLIALTTGATFAVLLGVGTLSGISRAQAHDDDDEDGEQFKVRRGFEIAPVLLNMEHKNWRLVGLGSYLVNAVGSCNMCHSAGTATEFSPGGNPYKGNEPAVVNPATYLAGGRTFAAQVAGVTPPIVSRNLTPDKTGRPVGGRTFEEFLYIIRTGADLDHVHPNCSSTVTTGCFPASAGFDGDLLQVMPWPSLRHMTERELRAIYVYLSAIPCIAGPISGVLHNDCI